MMILALRRGRGGDRTCLKHTAHSGATRIQVGRMACKATALPNKLMNSTLCPGGGSQMEM